MIENKNQSRNQLITTDRMLEGKETNVLRESRIPSEPNQLIWTPSNENTLVIPHSSLPLNQIYDIPVVEEDTIEKSEEECIRQELKVIRNYIMLLKRANQLLLMLKEEMMVNNKNHWGEGDITESRERERERRICVCFSKDDVHFHENIFS